jgi:Zinc dependent phospholipase C
MHARNKTSMKTVLCRAVMVIALISMVYPSSSGAYSVLTHEAIIDVVWESHILPLLRSRFPDATAEELLRAHAFAYGGAIVQDMGYYPHGNKFFSDLTHYFRSGDFIVSLLHSARDLDDYAFAIGALAHYAADNDGHRLATNVAVPLLYPELRKKFGPVVTYEDNPLAHIKTEFSFDVLQVAKGHYAPDSYHQFVGFEVALPLLEEAFRFQNEQLAANSYRHSVNSLIPTATRVAWDLKQNEIENDLPGMTRKNFLYNLSRASFEKQWGKDYRRPSAGDKFLAFLIRILPKIGPLRILTFRTPTPQAEKLFENSFNVTIDRYRHLLAILREGHLGLPNDNFDVGEVTTRGKYKLNDVTCAELLNRLSKQKLADIDTKLKNQLLEFYANEDRDHAGKKLDKDERRIQLQLESLKESIAISSPTPESTAVKSQ